MYQENADDSGQSEDWRETLLMGVGDLKNQPSYHKDVERENLPEPPEQETTAEPVQENRDPTEQSGNGSSQQEGGTTAVNCQEVDMPSPAVQDTSVPSSSSTRPSRPKRTRRRPAYLNDFTT